MGENDESWCLIESNPDTFNELIRDFGVTGLQVEELLSLEAEEFKNLKTVHGLIFLFKWVNDDEPGTVVQESGNENIFFAKQVVANACATQAILSIVLNIDQDKDVKLGDTLSDFKEFTQSFDAYDRGLALGNASKIRRIHNSFSRQPLFEIDNLMEQDDEFECTRDFEELNQSFDTYKCKDQKDEDAFHYISFVPIHGRLYELDGLREGPIDLGAVGDNWLEAVRPIIKKRFQKYSEGEIRFNLMAVVPDRQMLAQRQLDCLLNLGEDESQNDIAMMEKCAVLKSQLEDEIERRKSHRVSGSKDSSEDEALILDSKDEEETLTIDHTTLVTFENCDDVRRYYVELMDEKDIHDEKAKNDKEKCRVIVCENKIQDKGVCSYHNRMGYAVQADTNGVMCLKEGCTRPSETRLRFCHRCSSSKTDDEDEDVNQPTRWSPEVVENEAEAIAEKCIEVIKNDDSTGIYIGLTTRAPATRVGEHKRDGKIFETWEILKKVPNLYTLADLEYAVVAKLSTSVNHRNIINEAAGGNFRLADMTGKGYLYALYAPGTVKATDKPTRVNFLSRQIYRRQIAVLTPRAHTLLPRFKTKVSVPRALQLLGIGIRPSRKEKRLVGVPCTMQDCKFLARDKRTLKSHVDNTHIIREYKCEKCPFISQSARREELRRHYKSAHALPLPPAKRVKLSVYTCGRGDCKLTYPTSQLARSCRRRCDKKAAKNAASQKAALGSKDIRSFFKSK